MIQNPIVFNQYAYEASKTYLQDADSKKNAINKALWEEIENPKIVTLNNNSKVLPDDVILEYDNKQWTIKDINQIFIDMLHDTLTNIIEKNKSNQEEELNFKNIFTDIKNIFG